jgi:hypothetical protein
MCSARGAAQRGAGTYLVVHYGDQGPTTVRTDEDGTTDVTRVAGGPVAEFATLGFVLHGLDLEAGRQLKVPGYTPALNLLTQMPLRVAGRVRLENAAGVTSTVWAVDLLSVNRATVIRFHVTREAPFFHGWEYRRVADGVVVSRFVLRDWQDLSPSRTRPPGAGG